MTRHSLTATEVGAMVRAIRKASGLRQADLAGAAGVGVRFIVDLEAGKPTVQPGKALLVLSMLGCSTVITPPPAPRNPPRP